MPDSSPKMGARRPKRYELWTANADLNENWCGTPKWISLCYPRASSKKKSVSGDSGSLHASVLRVSLRCYQCSVPVGAVQVALLYRPRPLAANMNMPVAELNLYFGLKGFSRNWPEPGQKRPSPAKVGRSSVRFLPEVVVSIGGSGVRAGGLDRLANSQRCGTLPSCRTRVYPRIPESPPDPEILT